MMLAEELNHISNLIDIVSVRQKEAPWPGSCHLVYP